MATRYSGSLRIVIYAQDHGPIGRFYYKGTVIGPEKGQRWTFTELSPSPMHVPGPEGLPIDCSEAYDRAAAAALSWAWHDNREEGPTDGEGWVFEFGEFHPDHETEDRFVVSRKPHGPIVWPVEV